MGDVRIVFVNNPGHPVGTIGTIHAVLSLRGFHGKSVFPVFPIHADGAVFAIDGDSRSIFASHTDGTVYAVFAFFTQIQIIVDMDLVRIVCCAGSCNGSILTVHQFGSILGNFIFQLADIYRIRSGRAGSHIVNLVATIIQSFFRQRNGRSSCCRIFRGNRNAAGINRSLIPVLIRHGRAASLRHGLVSVRVDGSHTVHIQIIIQDHFQRSVFHFRRKVFAVPCNLNILSQGSVNDIAILICQAEPFFRKCSGLFL